jgi:hypothetical protein
MNRTRSSKQNISIHRYLTEYLLEDLLDVALDGEEVGLDAPSLEYQEPPALTQEVVPAPAGIVKLRIR